VFFGYFLVGEDRRGSIGDLIIVSFPRKPQNDWCDSEKASPFIGLFERLVFTELEDKSLAVHYTYFRNTYILGETGDVGRPLDGIDCSFEPFLGRIDTTSTGEEMGSKEDFVE